MAQNKIGLLTEALLSANDCDSQECQRLSLQLGIKGYDLFNKPMFAAMAEKEGVDWEGIDNGVWCNIKGGKLLTSREIEEAVEDARRDLTKQS